MGCWQGCRGGAIHCLHPASCVKDYGRGAAPTTAEERASMHVLHIAQRTRLVLAAALPHGLELWPVDKAVAVLVHLPDHVLHLCLHGVAQQVPQGGRQQGSRARCVLSAGQSWAPPGHAPSWPCALPTQNRCAALQRRSGPGGCSLASRRLPAAAASRSSSRSAPATGGGNASSLRRAARVVGCNRSRKLGLDDPHPRLFRHPGGFCESDERSQILQRVSATRQCE